MASITIELTPDSDLADVIAHWDVNLDLSPGGSSSLKFVFPRTGRVYRLTVAQVRTEPTSGWVPDAIVKLEDRVDELENWRHS